MKALRPLERAADVIEFTWSHPANRSHRLRSTLSAIRFQLMGRLLGRRERAAVGNRSVIEADARVYHSARALYANPVDWNEMHAWRDALGPGSLFVDVGANVGLYTILAIEAGAEVISVEPSRIARDRLGSNLRLNGYTAEVVPAALGETEGTLRLTTELDNQNHLVLDGDSEGVESEEVPVLTLDGLVGDRTIDGLKVDVEGAELLVLLKLYPFFRLMEPGNHFDTPEVANKFSIGKIVVTQNDDKWVVIPRAKDYGLYILNKTNDQTKAINVTARFVNSDGEFFTDMPDIQSIAVDLNGEIWVGTAGGVAVYSNPEQIWTENVLYAARPGLNLHDGLFIRCWKRKSSLPLL